MPAKKSKSSKKKEQKKVVAKIYSESDSESDISNKQSESELDDVDNDANADDADADADADDSDDSDEVDVDEVDEDEIDEDNSVEDDEVENDDKNTSSNGSDSENDVNSENENDVCVYNIPSNLNIINRIEKLAQLEKEEKSNLKEGFVPADERIGRNYMTKYEWVRLISDRSAQIAYGSSIMIKPGENSVDINKLSHEDIAIIELETKRLPLYIVRNMPNGTREKWYTHELIFDKRFLK